MANFMTYSESWAKLIEPERIQKFNRGFQILHVVILGNIYPFCR